MMPLMIVQLGQECVVEKCRITGDLKRHMDNLGLLPGEKVVPIAQNKGDLIIRLRGSRLAINRGLAAKIYVDPVA